MAKQQWFISHPSGGRNHTPTFFSALEHFTEHSRKVELVFPHGEAERLHITKETIEKADLVLAEVSLASTGSGIEMGWANAAGRNVIAFHQGATTISPSIQFVATAIHTYVTEDHILDVLSTLA